MEGSCNHPGNDAGFAAPFRRTAAKNVGKTLLQFGDGPDIPVDGDGRALQLIEAAQIIEAKNMVCMEMGIKDGIHTGDIGGEGLQTKLSGRVDEDVLVPVSHQQ